MSNLSTIDVPKTSEGLRDALFDEINGLRQGKTTIQRAKVIATLASRVIESLRTQVQVQKLIEGKAKDVSLGSKAGATSTIEAAD